MASGYARIRQTSVLIKDNSRDIPKAFRFSGVVIWDRFARVNVPSSLVKA